MTILEAIMLLLTALVVPYVVQLIKTDAISGNAARWLAIGISVIAGIVSGLVGGVPANLGEWVTCILAAVGGVQVFYSIFKAVGITNKWLDALGAIGGTQNDLNVIKTQQSMADKAEERARKER